MRRAEVLQFEDHPDLEFGRIALVDRRALTIGSASGARLAEAHSLRRNGDDGSQNGEVAAHTDRHPTEWGCGPCDARRTPRAMKRCAWSCHPTRERRCIRFDQVDFLHAVSERRRRRNPLGEHGLPTDNSTIDPGGIRRLVRVLGVDAFLQHQQRLAPELGDATDRHSEEVGELLRCSPFEERADHDQTVTIGQETDRSRR